MCTPCHFYVSTCAPFVDLSRSMLLHLPLMYVNRMLCLYNTYNFQQRISWLSHRWRTQRNAISNVNCRIQWIIESLNAPCAPWYSEEHACLSVINITSNLSFVEGFGCGGLLASLRGSAPLKCISRTTLLIGVITIYAYVCEGQFSFLTVFLGQFIINVTSNQVGLPAELKHINKRRKRN